MFLRVNISSWSDQKLLEEYKKSGKTEYFGELYNRYIPLVYGVCLKYLQQPEQAEDAVMQLFEELLPKVKQYPVEVFRTWLYSVVKNHCLQLLRKDKREINVDFSSANMESEDFMHLLEEESTEDERLEILKKCMEKLPEQQRQTIVYFFMEEMSYAEIVEKTGYLLSRVKSYIQNGKRNLNICIKKHLA